MERAENGGSVTGAGVTVPIQTERRAELAQSLSERMARLGDAGLLGWSDSDRESIHHLFPCLTPRLNRDITGRLDGTIDIR